MAALRAATYGGLLDARATCEPDAWQIGDVRVVYLAGVVDESSWRWLAAEIDGAPAETRTLVASISSLVQCIDGWDVALEALMRAGERMTRVAHIHQAGGLAVWFAQACDQVAARAEAPIGWLSWESPLLTTEGGSEHQSRGFTPLGFGRKRRFTTKVMRRLRDRAVLAEALEGRGVDLLARDVAVAVRAAEGLYDA
jgi:hypothetical protein